MVLLAGATAFLSGLSPAVFGAPKSQLRIALNTEVDTLHPILNTLAVGAMVQDAVVRPLVALDNQGRPRAILLTKVPRFEAKTATLITQNSQKRLKAELEFRPDIHWGDGTPLTCKDLVTSWEVGKSDNVSTPGRQTYANILEIKVNNENPKKCTVLLAEPRWDFYLRLPRPIPAHIEGPIFKKYGSTPQAYEANSRYIKDPTHPGLYNGPYRVSEMVNGSHLILVPNARYGGPAPHLQKVIFKYVFNTSTMEANLISGAVDVISTAAMTVDQALLFEKKVQKQSLPFVVQIGDGYIYQHFDFNMDHPILKDLKVRQALTLGLNRRALMKTFFEDRFSVAVSFAHRNDSWFSDNPKEVQLYDFNLSAARKKLDEAGWKTGPDGYRYKSGQKLALNVAGPADNKLLETIEVFCQAAWKNLGVEISIKNYPVRVLFSEIIKKRKFELALYSFVTEPDFFPITMIHSKYIPSEANLWAGQNRSGWRNSQVDAWLDEVESDPNPQKRISLLKKTVKAYTEELPVLPLFFRGNTSTYPKTLKGYEISNHSYSEYLDIENWKFE